MKIQKLYFHWRFSISHSNLLALVKFIVKIASASHFWWLSKRNIHHVTVFVTRGRHFGARESVS
jgi:hypothetical protein